MLVSMNRLQLERLLAELMVDAEAYKNRASSSTLPMSIVAPGLILAPFTIPVCSAETWLLTTVVFNLANQTLSRRQETNAASEKMQMLIPLVTAIALSGQRVQLLEPFLILLSMSTNGSSISNRPGGSPPKMDTKILSASA